MQKDNVFYPTNSPTSACSSSLEAVSLPDLYDTSYTPATALIDNFLYSGVYILAGPPKTRQILPHGSACLPCCRRHGIF